MQGGAKFIGRRQQFRPILWRRWGEKPRRRILFIGMNPSTADAGFNDPTIAREVGFAALWGYNIYYKVNICDYRSTRPAGLLTTKYPCSRRNLLTVLKYAERADTIVLAYGKLHNSLQPYVQATLCALQELNHPLYCLGVNQDNSPKHPLYLSKITQLREYLP